MCNSGSEEDQDYPRVLLETQYLHQGATMSEIEPKDLSQGSAHPVHELGQHAHISIGQSIYVMAQYL
jgi:hypothetical protein